MSSDDDTLIAGAQTTTTGLTAPGALVANRYEVIELVGRGGMGVVFRVHDHKLDEVVALKLLTLESPESEERFLREVRVARKVTHPNVARTHDLGDHEGVPFLTMEYVAGEALDEIIERRGPLDEEEVRRVGAAIADGLSAAHEAGVVHRDLKPANVIIAEDGRVVLTDFGIARLLGGDATQTGGVIGTPHYMAPEQVAGQSADARADIYALGLMLYEMATGELPFGGDTPLSIAVARLTTYPDDPRNFASLGDALANLTLRCLARRPEARPASAAEVGDALRGSDASETRSTPSFFAPIDLGPRALAILPFVYRGSSEHDYLGEGLAEELIDVLSRTKGLKVLALGATRKFAVDRDPAQVHQELGADVMVDGTVQLSASRVRLTARLVEPNGVQHWTDRFDGAYEDVFDLQESLGRRVAEALRLELTAASHRHSAPPEALELYLRARRDLRGDIMSVAPDAVRRLERAMELAPDFKPAIAAHAIACVRAWWNVYGRDDVGRGEQARAAVERAVREAPGLAETQLAQAMYAVQHGRFREAARACAEAIEIAPTMPEAHQYLGGIQLEAGRGREGRERLELTLELDPTLNICHLSLARYAALSGERERAETHLAMLGRAFPSPTMPVLISHLRFALYWGERELAEELLETISTLDDRTTPTIVALGGLALGRSELGRATEAYHAIRDWIPNERFSSLMLQIVTEIFCAAGEIDLAQEALLAAANKILIDVVWLAHCPLLRPLRGTAGFDEARSIVEKRVAHIWRR